jgi:hypothetical protein
MERGIEQQGGGKAAQQMLGDAGATEHDRFILSLK